MQERRIQFIMCCGLRVLFWAGRLRYVVTAACATISLEVDEDCPAIWGLVAPPGVIPSRTSGVRAQVLCFQVRVPSGQWIRVNGKMSLGRQPSTGSNVTAISLLPPKGYSEGMWTGVR